MSDRYLSFNIFEELTEQEEIEIAAEKEIRLLNKRYKDYLYGYIPPNRELNMSNYYKERNAIYEKHKRKLSD